MHRLFVALRPPPDLRQQLLAVMGGLSHVRWQSEEQLHVTLRFIGEVDRHQAEAIALALGNVRVARPTMAIEGIGSFGSAGKVHSLWAGVTSDAALTRLRHSAERALASAGVAPDRRAFRPHVTLARGNCRAASVETWLAERAGLRLPAVAIPHIILFESVLGREGATYDAVARYPLD